MNFNENERVYNLIMSQIEHERTSLKKARIKKLSTVAAMLTVVILLGACAVKVFNLDDRIASVIGGKNDVLEQVATPIDDYYEENGIRIEGKQAIGDGHKMYISVDVISVNDVVFENTNGFESSYVIIDKDNIADASNVYPINTVQDNGKKLSLVLAVDTKSTLTKHHVELYLSNLSKSDGSEVIIQEGLWKIEFDVNCEGVMESFDISKQITISGVELEVNRMDISPISFELDADLINAYELTEEELLGMGLFDQIELFISDSKCVLVTECDIIWSSEGNKLKITVKGKPADFIDPNEVKTIYFNDQKIELK